MHARLALVLIALGACGSSSSSQPPRLISEEEIARYEKQVMDRLEASKVMTCKRPVLRGEPLPGPAAPDMMLLTEPTGSLATCLTSLETFAKNLDMKKEVEARTPALLEIEKTCGAEIEAALARAVSHEDSCSPYRSGARADLEVLMPRLRLAHFLGLRARVLAGSGDGVKALWLLLDGIQLFQDLARGRVTLISSMVHTASVGILLQHIEALLDAVALAKPDVDALADAVDKLLASEPPFSDVLEGERDFLDLTYALAPLKPEGWVPPGGWQGGKAPPRGSADGTKPMMNARDESAIMFLVSEEIAKETVAACPPGASYRVCSRGFKELSSRPATPNTDDIEKLYSDLVKSTATQSLSPEQARLQIRSTIVQILKSIATPSFARYPEKRAQAVVALTALRLHLQVLRHQHFHGTCPDKDDFARPPFPALANPPVLGDPVGIAVVADGYEVTPPIWTEVRDRAWRIRCQAR